MDEAGRGPAIGPIVFGIVVITKEQGEKLKEIGIQDSKTLSHKVRVEYAGKIKDISLGHSVYILSAEQIDDMRGKGTNLNQIEVIAFKRLLDPFKDRISVLQLDAADVDEKRFGDQFKSMIKGKIDSRHKGDAIFIAVAAASILAKVKRDEIIKKLQDEMDQKEPDLPSFGSGYPTDAKPFIRAYVKKYRSLPKIARKSWKTSINILQEVTGPKQTSLDDFG